MVGRDLYDVTRYQYIDSNGTYITRSGETKLYRIIINGTDSIAGEIIVYDNNAASGDVVAKFNIAAAIYPYGSYEFDLPLHTGLTVVVSSLSNAYITVVYQ